MKLLWYAELRKFSERQVGSMCTFGTAAWGKRHAMTAHPMDHDLLPKLRTTTLLET